jgi:hypothetical protein
MIFQALDERGYLDDVRAERSSPTDDGVQGARLGRASEIMVRNNGAAPLGMGPVDDLASDGAFHFDVDPGRDGQGLVKPGQPFGVDLTSPAVRDQANRGQHGGSRRFQFPAGGKKWPQIRQCPRFAHRDRKVETRLHDVGGAIVRG